MAELNGAAGMSPQDAEKIFNEIMTCEPLMSTDDATGIESLLNGSGSAAVMRRIGLSMAEKNGAWFKRLVEDRDMAQTVLAQLDDVEECAKLLREVADVIDASCLRARLALCGREDLEDLKLCLEQHAVLQRAAH